MTQKMCCDAIQFYLNEDEVYMGYSPKFRSYYLDVKGEKGSSIRIDYCPWCGSKLPKALDKEFDQELSKEMNISIDDIDLDMYSNNNSKVSKEFKSEEWWKKRGL